MDTILVTGGAGFVGSYLSCRLKEERPRTRILAFDNLRRRGSELNISRLTRAGVEFLHGDIRKNEDLNAIGPFDVMIECSAEPSVLAGYREPPDYVVNTNLVGAINCLNAVLRHKAVLVFLSTSRVYPIDALNKLDYGESESRFETNLNQITPGATARGISEKFSLQGVRSLYGATKLAAELIIQEYAAAYDLQAVINRCGVLTGPWQMGKVDQGFVVLWVARHIYSGQLQYIGFGANGKQVRDILHVDDLYRLVSQQLQNTSLMRGEVYNIGGGRDISTSLLELTRLCKDVTGIEIDIGGIKEKRRGDIRHYVSDYSKAEEHFGWRPLISNRAIVEEIAAWIEENKKELQPILC